jgi:hypothetical protein
MEALTLTRADYNEALERLENGFEEGQTYLSMFSVTFPDGINTANTLEICRVIQNPTFENKIRLMKICIAGKNVEVKCPCGDIQKFCMTDPEDNLEGFPLFHDDPLALIAIADALYGHILKKYVRLSKPREAAAKATD